jgi:hypothetical protein
MKKLVSQQILKFQYLPSLLHKISNISVKKQTEYEYMETNFQYLVPELEVMC